MPFTPLTPGKLDEALADWILLPAEPLGSAGTVIGFDGPSEIGTVDLADRVADGLRSSGRPVIRASANWWWRPPALRLEMGREDVDMLLTGWVDSDAIRRELIAPIVLAAGSYITRLRDPESGRSVRQEPRPAQPGAVLLLDGPFLLAAGLPLDSVVGFAVSRGAIARALPEDRTWWGPAFERYRSEYDSESQADVLLSYDHPSAPAASGLHAAPTERRRQAVTTSGDDKR